MVIFYPVNKILFKINTGIHDLLLEKSSIKMQSIENQSDADWVLQLSQKGFLHVQVKEWYDTSPNQAVLYVDDLYKVAKVAPLTILKFKLDKKLGRWWASTK